MAATAAHVSAAGVASAAESGPSGEGVSSHRAAVVRAGPHSTLAAACVASAAVAREAPIGTAIAAIPVRVSAIPRIPVVGADRSPAGITVIACVTAIPIKSSVAEPSVAGKAPVARHSASCEAAAVVSAIVSVHERVVAIESRTVPRIRMSAEENSSVEAPANAPSMPAPAESEERRDRESEAERNERPAKSPPRHEPRPVGHRIAVNVIRVILRHVDHLRIGRLNLDLVVAVVHALLRRGPQIARGLGFAAHVLDG